MPADVSTSHSKDPNENTTEVVLPGGEHWYLWNTTTAVNGGQAVTHTLVALDEMYVCPRFVCNARRVGRPSGGSTAQQAVTPRDGRPPLLGSLGSDRVASAPLPSC